MIKHDFNVVEDENARDGMNHELLVLQTRLESRALEHITQALEVLIS